MVLNENFFGSSGYYIEDALKFNAATPDGFTYTPGTAGSTQKFTYSGWVKPGIYSTGASPAVDYDYLWGISNAQTDAGTCVFMIWNGTSQNEGTIVFWQWTGTSFDLYSKKALTDSTSWAHIVFAVDTTQAVDTNRVRLYVNGIEWEWDNGVRNTTVYPPQNYNFIINTLVEHQIGHAPQLNNGGSFGGCMAEVHIVDGQQLTPQDFGKFDTYQRWVPKKYVGTYGTNGCYLKFDDISTTTTLGADSSGNGNNWSPRAGAFDLTDQFYQSPTVDVPPPHRPGQSDTGIGGEVYANYPRMTQPMSLTSGGSTLKYGGLEGGSAGHNILTTEWPIYEETGTYYWEARVLGVDDCDCFGIVGSINDWAQHNNATAGDGDQYVYEAGGNKINQASSTAYGATFVTNDIIGVLFNTDTDELTFYKNGVSQGVAFTVSNALYPYAPVAGDTANGPNSSEWVYNFGDKPFQHAAPAGAKCLCSANPSVPVASFDPSEHYETIEIDAGTGSGGVTYTLAPPFSPDIIWTLGSSSTYIQSTGRGPSNAHNVRTGYTVAEANGVTSFNVDGFTVGTSYDDVNPRRFWCWNAGSEVQLPQFNSDGNISSFVRADTARGISAFSYDGDVNNSTVGHGLGAIPEFVMIFTNNNTEPTAEPLALMGTGLLGYVGHLNDRSDTNAPVSTTLNHTTSVIDLSNVSDANADLVPYYGYAFRPVPGFSAMGFYQGHAGSAFTNLRINVIGFKPRFVLVKDVSSPTVAGGNWTIFDGLNHDQDNTSGTNASYSIVNNSTRSTGTSGQFVFRQCGFGMTGSNSDFNDDGDTYFYMAFAENPFGQTLSF